MLALSHTITVAWIVILQIVQGIINAFDTPARQSFVVQMVDDRATCRTPSPSTRRWSTRSRIVGPSLGGLIIAAVGEGWCFAIDAVSYIAVIISLLAMNVEPRRTAWGRGKMLDELKRRLPVRIGVRASADMH